MSISKPNAGRILVIGTFALLVSQSSACRARSENGGRAAPGGARPPEILSWRHQILPQERYAELAGEWEAYAARHPGDVRALVEWGDALRYAGKRDEATEKYTRAREAGEDDAAAITAYTAVQAMYDGKLDWAHAHAELQRAARIDPDYPDTYYTLWLTSMHERDEKTVELCLRRMVETGDMPQPLLDCAFNMLVGAPRDAIIFTNGDNDTYPPHALQTIGGMRSDVAVVNLSLLNTTWYIRLVRDSGIPIGLEDAAIDSLTNHPDRTISARIQQRIFEAQRSEASPRPLLYSVTVPESNRAIPARTVLEGALVRVVRDGAAAGAEPDFDLDRTRELFDTVYRLDGLMDPKIDWARESSVGRIAFNFVPLLSRVGTGLFERTPREDGSPYLLRAVRLAAFHGMKDPAAKIVDEWARLDPGSSSLAEARAVVEATR